MSHQGTVVYVARPEETGPVQETLTDAGLRVKTASSIAETLELCAGVRPGLIIVEQHLHKGSALELVEELRADAATISLPVMVLMESNDLADRLKVLEADVDDCLSRPFEPAELAARARTLLRRMTKLVAAGLSVEALVHRKVTYLQKCALTPLRKLEPTRNVHSAIGYSYDDAREHFNCAPGEEVTHLEDLATRTCLERSFFDRINLCPQCGHHAVNVRQVCPVCRSSDVSQVDVIYHLACDHVAPRREYGSGDELVCPHCQQTLGESGSDYEPLTEGHICNSCQRAFINPDAGCLCLNCGSAFEGSQFVGRHIYTYGISDRGLLAAQTGHLHDATLDMVLLDYGVEVYNRSYFHRQLSLEIKRSGRYKHPFGLAIIRLDRYDQLLRNYGETSRQYLARVASVIKSNTRSADVPGKHEKNSIVMLFPETDLDGTRLACEKLCRGVFELTSPRPDVQLTLSCAVTAYPEAADDETRLLKSLSEAFDEACQGGGNVVVTAETPDAIPSA